MGSHETKPEITVNPARGHSAQQLTDLLEPIMALARELLEHENNLPAEGSQDPSALEQQLSLGLGSQGLDQASVLERMRRVLRATPSTSSWRFLNQLFGGRVPIATAAEMLASLANVSMYTYKAAGVQVLVEQVVLCRMAQKVGFLHGEGCFTPGGSIANQVAMLLARDQHAPDFRDRGSAPSPLIVYTSEEGHYSIRKNAGILGIGRNQVHLIPVGLDGRMDVGALRARIKEDQLKGLHPMMINATAGTTVRGAFDPIRELVTVAQEQHLWLHVDGALGGSMVMSSAYRHLVDGSELADSYAWNPHKMMGIPLQESALLVARKGTLARSLDETADYLFQTEADELNPGHRSIQCGRRNDGFKLWAAWLQLGDEGWGQRIDRQMTLATRAAELIEADPELSLVEWPSSINVCFEVKNRSSEDICSRLDEQGRLKIGHGTVRGRRAIRLVCVNPDLDEATLKVIFEEIKTVGRALPVHPALEP